MSILEKESKVKNGRGGTTFRKVTQLVLVDLQLLLVRHLRDVFHLSNEEIAQEFGRAGRKISRQRVSHLYQQAVKKGL